MFYLFFYKKNKNKNWRAQPTFNMKNERKMLIILGWKFQRMILYIMMMLYKFLKILFVTNYVFKRSRIHHISYSKD